jgi:uncharacterized membrane protein YdcZ (DUF606 family)
MSRFTQRKNADLTSTASLAVVRAAFVSMLVGTVLVVLIWGLRGVT